MADVYEKVDDSTLKKIYTKEETYNYDMLIKKKSLYEAELAKVNTLIAEGIKLGLLTKEQQQLVKG